MHRQKWSYIVEDNQAMWFIKNCMNRINIQLQAPQVFVTIK